MNVGQWLVWGFGATVLLTTIFVMAQALGLTRMNVAFLLGSMVTPSRDRARLVGIVMHLINGWLFSIVYVAAFHMFGRATWWLGAGIGAVHAAFVLGVALPALPGMHPRMASEYEGPTALRQLEPPGFFGMNYGIRTPVAVMLAHMLFGATLGTMYRV
jgi:uncharacterized membrane protein YagU involved in acid resistance